MNQPPRIAVLNGPNLNLLGAREPALYGTTTLAGIEQLCSRAASEAGYVLDFRQTNHEGQLIDWIQEIRTEVSGIVVNAAAFTHTSIALHDALLTVMAPVIEVHLTNVHAREDYRRRSFVSETATAVIAGCGAEGYRYAIEQIAGLHLAVRKASDVRPA